MRFLRWTAPLAAVLVVGFVLPAAADHVAESQTPITGVILRVQNYVTKTPYLCDGTDQFSFPNVRIEADATADTAPTEHFRVELIIGGPDGEGNQRLVWDGFWRHQNVPPHPSPSPTRGWEVMQTNLRVAEHAFLGVWRVVVNVTGNESGVTFSDSCEWTQI